MTTGRLLRKPRKTSKALGPAWTSFGASNLNLSGKPTVAAENPLSQSSGPPVTGPTPFTQSTWFADPYLKRPYGDQWNFGIQQQIASKDVLTVNYVGGAGSKLDVGGAYNVASQPGGNVGCPSYATDPEHFNCGAPFPYIGVTAYDRSVGKSSYNALQATLNGRARHGLTYLISYTFSKSLDLGCDGFYGVEGCSIQNPYNLQGERGMLPPTFRKSSPSPGSMKFHSGWVDIRWKIPQRTGCLAAGV